MATQPKKALSKPARKQSAALDNVTEYRHEEATRKNNPPAKIAAEGTVPLMPKIKYEYSPRLAPALRFDPTGAPDRLPELLAEAKKRPLKDDELKVLAEALRTQEPWLEWANKRERRHFEVDPVALHIHERVSPQAILRVAARQDVEPSLFADPQQQYHEAVQFYRHEIPWTNRLILGDSLQVMVSLSRREDLAGKVQMIYMDPPYGIKFASNFQPEVGRRDVKDKEQDLTRELEMVKAYRDTWHLGIHSYLGYLRDRLVAAKELLADRGSIFVQIGVENVHRVRALMDEIFERDAFMSLITVKKTATPSSTLDDGSFYILWYARNPERIKFRPIYLAKPCDEWARETPGGSWGAEIKGVRRPLTPEEKENTNVLPPDSRVYCLSKMTSAGPSARPESFYVFGQSFSLGGNEHWKTGEIGRERLVCAERVEVRGRAWFTRFYDDGQFKRMNNIWEDTAGKSGQSFYVVQTQTDVIARCMLMTTDPGDIVLDPTCGGGTTAFASEQWGRRWITIDTSRVAIAIARQRLLTQCRFEYYELRPVSENDLRRNPEGPWLTGGDVSVYPSSDTDLVIDINGYFAPAGQGGLSLYPTVPCRVIDTRLLGPPFSGTLTPPVDVVDSPCGLPVAAQAYVFNATVVPQGVLGYLTLWPDGDPKPLVSTLNALDGSITNNMAIVPSTNGKVDAYASGITQLILDISSYFAP